MGFTGGDGAERRVPLAEAARLPLEEALPARRIVSRRGQRHLPGQWWSATDGRHVGFESWLERDHLMLLDFDPAVTAVASQPFWLWWTAADGTARRHAPDYFARRADGTGIVVDCRPEDRRGGDRDRDAFAAAREASGAAGWEYRLVGGCDRVLAANVRWLAAYRHPAAPRARGHCPAAGSCRGAGAADGPGGVGGRPAGGAAGAVSPAVAA